MIGLRLDGKGAGTGSMAAAAREAMILSNLRCPSVKRLPSVNEDRVIQPIKRSRMRSGVVTVLTAGLRNFS